MASAPIRRPLRAATRVPLVANNVWRAQERAF